MHAWAIHFLFMTTAPIPQYRKLRQRLEGVGVQSEAQALTCSWVMRHGQSQQMNLLKVTGFLSSPFLTQRSM